MSYLKEKWTEQQVLNLTADEHGFLERKAGKLLEDKHEFYKDMAKALSAFANSGGGNIIIGQGNDGSFDGLPPAMGRTPIREWLEQILPTLVSYPLETIRVHAVERDTNSQFPTGREVIVVDIGDSRLAPHQAAIPKDSPQYYYRPAGKSVPAPHHVLESLRNRMTFAVLQARLESTHVRNCWRHGENIDFEMVIRFAVKNVSRVACYHWSVAATVYVPHHEPMTVKESGVSAQIAILPTCEAKRGDEFKLIFPRDQKVGWFVRNIILPTEVHFYPICDGHIGELTTTKLGDVISDVNHYENIFESRVKNV